MNLLCLGAFLLFFMSCDSNLSSSDSEKIPDHGLWSRPEIVPIPTKTGQVEKPVLRLGGSWLINTNPGENYWADQGNTEDWKEVIVPSSIEKQGFNIRRGEEYAYKKSIIIPKDYASKRVILRFEGVTGTAKAWINGNFLKEHYGGFNVWTCDITDFVIPGQEAVLTVGVVDEERELSTTSFNHGGIVRSVKLMAVPKNHITRFNVETDLDDSYEDALLKVWTKVAFSQGEKVRIKPTLIDPSGKIVPLQQNDISLDKKQPEKITVFNVKAPIKWDAEHPNLYTLRLELIENNEVAQVLTKKVGFREITIEGKKMLVNGQEVKLRGAGRFDSDPDFGKYLSDKKAWEEVRMLKEANLNFVRPSCYPATNAYLDACDSLGLYVQVENSVTFTRGTQKDTAYTALYMDQMAEMIEEVRSHPSIIIYELANETYYGVNITKTYEYAKAEDPTRPVIFSWSQSVPEGVDWPYDIYSYHYPDWDTDLGSAGVAVFNSDEVRPLPTGMPVLHDEFAHGSSYYQQSLARDPGMRNFWGESIKVFWERMFTTEGCLGGAMWAIIDENAYGSWAFEWGAIDLWRRTRPEYWHMKKAYSPVRIGVKEFEHPGNENSLILPMKNWFDHTNLNELDVSWKVGEATGQMKGPDIMPHSDGEFEIPYEDWKENDQLELSFTDSYGRLIDRYLLKIAGSEVSFPAPSGPAPSLQNNPNEIIVSGEGFEIVFDKNNGLIKSGTYNGQLILKGGPYFQLTGGKMGKWVLKDIAAKEEGNEVVVSISGTNEPVEISFELRIDGAGLITTNYELLAFGVEAPTPRKKPWDDQDAGGFQEVGVSYLLTANINELEWDRNGLWTCYPEDHIGRNRGTAKRTSDGKHKIFGEEPERPWSQDERDFSVFGQYDIGGRGTNDFKSMKESINYASALDANGGVGVRIESDGTEAVRLAVQEDESSILTIENMTFHGDWTMTPDSVSYFGFPELMCTREGDGFTFSFEGSGFAWIGTNDRSLSAADIYIDGKLVEDDLIFYSRGKSPNSIFYSKEGLKEGSHTVKIVAQKRTSGRGQRDEVKVPVGAIKILDGATRGDVLMIVNDQWNYTKMGLGNYMKLPIYIEPGYKNQVQMRLIGKESFNN
ncbi:glycoside hydrolase family 2 TIM barrel-domain containing protein [Reichenbachiella ulvae]|uniref:beta-galactosidase n=1 Tax=Reichenbachiella ulvae TaxID=2980104 RepID=A0ABT3CUV2_9BACT|nr:glycoside hydrolase family 2 TIM barrel-domain containing protein [Reichenbachiella ulvae]MCV9387338.1 hypothetical protein [Reichenbachiella ulvae]